MDPEAEVDTEAAVDPGAVQSILFGGNLYTPGTDPTQGPGPQVVDIWQHRILSVARWWDPSATEPPKRPKAIAPPPYDGATYWERHRPDSFSQVPWLGRSSPLLSLRRSWLARWVGEKTGHWNFHSYHSRFDHPASAYAVCACGAPSEKDHYKECPSRKVIRWQLRLTHPQLAEAIEVASVENAITHLKKLGVTAIRNTSTGLEAALGKDRTPTTTDSDDGWPPVVLPIDTTDNGPGISREEDTGTPNSEPKDGGEEQEVINIGNSTPGENSSEDDPPSTPKSWGEERGNLRYPLLTDF
ncbi:hypothetical protein QBC34DRAFT_313338 [Podospora aff. communis PSN243]|uniref:Uncharacterized protein n=1 Tax=Podospora aff. communis PSN243 TaxID=3040156 RepID=A0AAV9G4D6_9PEZI|nr:hypothetical protein QBC34DRAFT_313338 [Podospora aff. communis PSN243]